MAEKILTHEETIALLNQKAKVDGDDFLLKVHRKRSPGAMAEAVAILSGAQMVHIDRPETWLPQLAGGGPVFLVAAYHAKDPAVQLGGWLSFHISTDKLPPKLPGEIDPDVIRKAGWAGPVTLEWPKTEDVKPNQGAYQISTATPASSNGGNAANTAPVTAGSGSPSYAQAAELLAQIERAKAGFDAEKKSIDEDRRRAEIEGIRRDSELRIRELESKANIAAQTAAQNAAQPKVDVLGTITAIATALTPLLVKMFEGQNEMKLAMLKQQEASTLQQQALIQSMLAKPAVDPATEKTIERYERMIERMQANQTPQHEMVSNMASSMGSMMEMTMQAVQTAAELNMGGKSEDPMALKALKEVMKSVQSMFAGYRAAIPAGARPANPYMNGNGPAQAVLPANGLPPRVPQTPVPAPAPIPAPSPAPASAASQNLADIGEQSAKFTVVDKLERMIKTKTDVGLVAQTLIGSLDDADLQTALAEANFSPNELIAKRLGSWVMTDADNALYVEALISEVQKQGEAAGILDDEESETEEDDVAEAETSAEAS